MKVFNYIEELDAFVPTKEFKAVVEKLRLAEWTPVVFICRFLAMDNDYGEHIFDNWDEREALKEKVLAMGKDRCKELGLDVEEDADWAGSATESLLIIVPESFKDRFSRPCHSDGLRKAFWTDVCKSMDLSLDFIFGAARENAAKMQERYGIIEGRPDIRNDWIGDIEKAILEIKAEYEQ